MRVGWDITTLAVPPTGIGRYVRELLGATALAGPEHEFVAVSLCSAEDQPALAERGGSLPPRVRRHHMGVRGARYLRRAINGAPFVPSRLLGGPFDWFVGSEWLHPRMPGVAYATIVFDLIPLRFPEWVDEPTQRLHQRHYETLRRADLVICISSYTANDVVERLGVDRDRIVVAHPGVSDRFLNAVPDASWVPGLGGRPFICALGTLDPRKNIPMLVDAFAILRENRPELALVLVGPEGRATDAVGERVVQLGVEDHVIRTGYLPDEQVPGVVAAAKAFAFPSLFEGYGMPIAEAIAAGVPTVVGDHPSMDEACAGRARRSRLTPEDLASALSQVEDIGAVPSAGMPWTVGAEAVIAAMLSAPRRS